ncbi:cation diffusion facilitator CzcD-associated flavoprotein CzcO [Antricoccus suffuscus]|uniref:Cation diffusion facilitator CzcD-associated flavoprotein CzcO n=1 Tax=Antricoccus suffuscus TaxID=1629062 RepID=A0A2T0ZY89_9ACTN|nr:NAD(P)/FAD-dependent oxidoreductase [Antricoccus suffuscus]PRZ41048.1 cation diffusion facilitator CzcD-associated flavoprotein CzcO [Antricoccus suffuscus]
MTQAATKSDTRQDANLDYDVVIIGAGFAGMYQLHTLRSKGFRCHVYETGDGVGGTWYWNRYPGARCDVESVYYSYSFDKDLEQEWTWPERYSAQPDILKYADHVADRFDLRKDITFETRVDSLEFDQAANIWSVHTDKDEIVQARYVVAAIGCLSSSQIPQFDGMDDFRGKIYHTGRWPHEDVDLDGKRVGVVGTGSSAIQTITKIAPSVGDLTVFQRTPNFSIPANNRPLTEDEIAAVKSRYPQIRETLRRSRAGIVPKATGKTVGELTPEDARKALQMRWEDGGLQITAAFEDTLVNPAANDVVAEFVRSQIREIVDDPHTAELLSPKTYPIGTKRCCVDTGYFESYNRDNVHLVDLNAGPIERFTAQGLRAGGKDYEFDVIILATGFDAMTGPLNNIDIRGGAGSLKEKWEHGPRTYLGIMSEGFPNLFMITGPGSPSVLSNMIVSIEQHVDWVTDTIGHLDESGMSRIEPVKEAEDKWVDRVNEAASMTLMPQANSWYMGANIPGKTRIFMPFVGGVNVYRDICDKVVADGYDGFALA